MLALDPAQVHIEGAGTVVAVDQVLDVVGAHATTPLPRLDTVRLRDEVLDVPGVREARVTREWPQGLAVVLVAREPVAAVPEQPGAATPGATPGRPASRCSTWTACRWAGSTPHPTGCRWSTCRWGTSGRSAPC